jgi:hypothetical protein
MKLNYAPHFTRNYSKAPVDIQRAFDTQALLLLQALRTGQEACATYGRSR